MGRKKSVSPVRGDGSPRRRSSPRRDRSPARRRTSNSDRLSSRHRSPKGARSRSPAFHSPERPYGQTKSPNRSKSPSRSPVRHKPSNRARSPNHEKSGSPPPLSPRSKRLKRAKAERDAEKGTEREHEKSYGKKSDRAIREGKDLEGDFPAEKTKRRSGREDAGNGSRSRHGCSDLPSERNHSGQRRSRSPHVANRRGRDELTNSRDTEQRNGGSESLAKMKAVEESLEEKEKHKPSFELSGKLAAETNRVRGVTLLFNEPPDARKPDIRWRLYVFKAGEVLNEPLYVHRQSCYLFGRERRVADIPTDHPSCSKQHAVLQYRQVVEENPEDGAMSKRVRPYVMDLGSTNGTFINDEKMEPQLYYELFEKDTIKFGNSSREYVLLHENSAG